MIWALGVFVLFILAVLVFGFWALRFQSRQYPPGTRIPNEAARKPGEPRWTGWTQGGGHG